MDCKDKSTEELLNASMDTQVNCAAGDSIGLCVFGRSVTNINHPMIITALNDALGTELPNSYLRKLGRETLILEDKFNQEAGFNEKDDELPSFFYDESLPPTNNRARHHSRDVNNFKSNWLEIDL